MTTLPWMAKLDGSDPSMPTALAALVRAAGPGGDTDFSALLLTYREVFLYGVRGANSGPSLDPSADDIRDHLTQSALPRLAVDGWIADSAADGWARIRIQGNWWASASADRAGTFVALLALAHRGAPRAPAYAVPTATRSVLEGRELSKSFKGRRVVDDVSIRVEQGEIVGLLGPNGAGKTTTFYLITGLIRPDEGSVVLDGRDLTRAPMYRRARSGIGYLAQEPSIFRKMTVEENILSILETRPLSRAERRRRLEKTLDELSIKHLRRSRAYALSGGERRRLEITRALVTDPKFMLLDEPFAGVDPIAVHDIQMIVAGLRHRGIGVLITDHNVEQTLDIVDRAYIMFEGRVQAAGTVRELVLDDSVAQSYLGPTLTMRLRARLEAVA